MSNNAIRRVGGALLAGTVALSLAACGDSSVTSENDAKHISLGVVRAWSDNEVAGAVIEHKARDLGYEVTWEEVGDPPLLFAAVAQGDVDIYASTSIDRTHKDFYERYQDDLEVLGAYYHGMGNMLAVPEYSAMRSIEDIHDHWDEVGRRIIGIEPGSGMTQVMNESVLPAYGFAESDMITSSTPAMLAELRSAMNAGDEIVVTLWSPFWAMVQFDVRPLEDPLGAFAEPESIYMVAAAGFSESHPELAAWAEDFELTEEEFSSLENLIVNEYEDGEEDQALAEWLEDYPHVFDES